MALDADLDMTERFKIRRIVTDVNVTYFSYCDGMLVNLIRLTMMKMLQTACMYIYQMHQ